MIDFVIALCFLSVINWSRYGIWRRILEAVPGEEQPKYLNSPETPVFHKGSALYGLYEAHKLSVN